MQILKKSSNNTNTKPNGRLKTVEELSLERRRREAAQKKEESNIGGENVRKKKAYVELTPLQRIGCWAGAIVLVILAAYLFAASFCTVFVVQDGSMEPSLSAGDTYLINVGAYRTGSPKRGDIIVFRYNSSDISQHVKRVIALPGETIQIKDGLVLIDGEPLDSGKYPEVIDPGMAYEPITLDPDEYFVLGDNRNGSEDSRYNSVGNIDRNYIVGKLWLRILPITRIRLVG